MTNFLGEFLSAPLWAKVFLNVTILFAYMQLGSRNRVKLRLVRSYILLVMFRDLLFFFVPQPAVLIVSDLIVLMGYHYWLRSFTGQKSIDLFFNLYNAVLLIYFFFDIVLPASIIPDFVIGIMRVGIFPPLIFFIVQMFQVSPHNTDEFEVVVAVRWPLSLSMLAYHTLMMLLGDTNPISHAVILPAFYLVQFWVVYRYNTILNERDSVRIRDLEADIESLFDFMRNIGNAITEHIEIKRILNYIVSSAVRNSRADAGVIYLVDDFEDVLKLNAISGVYPPPYHVADHVKIKNSTMMEYLQAHPIEIGEGILGEVAKSGRAEFIRDTTNEIRMSENSRNDLQYISSFIAIPLIVSNKILGVLSVVKKDRFSKFSEADFTNIRSFADYTSLSLDNLLTYMELLEKKEMEREVGIAADIQQKLLPRKLPRVKNAKIAAFSKPARGVSGDYYDVMRLKRGKIAMIICDVAGKGVPASLVMIMIRSILHLIAGAQKDAATIVNWINRGITGKIDIDHFATLSFLTYDPDSGVLEYSNAGHHPMMVYRAETNDIESVDTEGLPIGIEGAATYQKTVTTLRPGDMVLLYTDGIIEAMDSNGNQFSYEKLKDFVLNHPEKDPEKLVKEIQTEINSFVGAARQHDDQTMLAMKVG